MTWGFRLRCVNTRKEESMIKKNDLAKCANGKLQAFTALDAEVKCLLKANRGIAQKFTKDREWVSNGGEGSTYASNGIYRLDPAARTAPETVTFDIRANDDGDYRAIDTDGILSGHKSLAHLVAKRGFKCIVYVDASGRELTATRLDAIYGRPVRAIFDAAAL